MTPRSKCAFALLAVTLAAIGSPAIAADGLGRLFMTPAQRLDLDRRRQADAQDSLVSSDNFVTANGQVSRSSGKTTTWINGQAQHGQAGRVDPAKIAVPMGEDQPSVSLKIGETLDKARGDRRDIVGEGQVRVPAGRR